MSAAALLALAIAAAPPAATGAATLRCEGMAAPTLAESIGNVVVARPRTEREARRAARAGCRARLDTLVLPDGRTVQEARAADPALDAAAREAVRVAVEDATVVHLADGGTRLEVEVPLDGPLATARAAERR